ncbi:PREDICTED: NTF2-related export protein 2 isoform X2 [Pseudopodoces humilis]|uniref:NTF2-related export protein 2 isoform X2 n=1 Tax=Pseudopodoces humilis TaxID=181119 RepID=UPI0006B7B73A|nr:PREDICTED: NTF2-related export protein 2 isoform X2 [Pseudopodoces humilis]
MTVKTCQHQQSLFPIRLLLQDFKTYVDQACRAADEFVNIYYETMDKRRRALTRLYLDKATLVWNGNAVSGQEELNKFFEMLPSSEFQVNVLDCQPVHDQIIPVQPVSETKPAEELSTSTYEIVASEDVRDLLLYMLKVDPETALSKLPLGLKKRIKSS